MSVTVPENRFEVFFDSDIDGAVLQVGLLHAVIGPPRPAIRVGTGAVEITVNGHHSDIDTMIDALKAVRRRIRADLKAKSA